MSFPFLDLPLELRESIYSLYFKPADRLYHSEELNEQGFFGGVYRFDFDLYHVNKQLHREAQAVWKRENVFVKIATPWPSAGMYRVYLLSEEGRDWNEEARTSYSSHDDGVNHIASEGLVPIVCTDRRANAFTTHTALVTITAPFHQAVPEHTVIVLLDDIHLFTQTWYYSALSYPMLNDRLSTSFDLVSADTPLALQRRLLLPFSQIKGLYNMSLSNYAPEVIAQLRKGMSIPIPTLQQAVESSFSHLEAGDLAISQHNPTEARDQYTQAFHAIHILIAPRSRRILADIFFHATIPAGIFAHQTGSSVRVVLRLKLVSRMILTHLHLREPREAAFWGLRSISIMRESMDIEYEDFLSEFVGGEDVRMIYVRTGIALWIGEAEGWREGGETSERLWGLARKFFRGRGKEGVRRELREFGVGKDVVRLFADEDAGSVSAQAGSGE